LVETMTKKARTMARHSGMGAPCRKALPDWILQRLE
jgi:hypothetical protein